MSATARWFGFVLLGSVILAMVGCSPAATPTPTFATKPGRLPPQGNLKPEPGK